jgi:helicase
MLREWEFVKKEHDRLSATLIGKRVSELYIDPLTAHNFLLGLDNYSKKQADDFSILQLISNTIEMQPLVGVKTNEYESIQSKIIEKSSSFLQDIPEEYDYEFDSFFKSVKTAMLFEDWINEATDDKLLERYNIAPGEMRGKLQIADWLLYSLQELALIKQFKDVIKNVRKVRVRMMYGVKEELLSLIKLRGIGRVRARKLFKARIKTLEDARRTPLESLSIVLGKSVAESIKEQLEKPNIKKFTLYEINQT